jgi:hypothetical protein
MDKISIVLLTALICIPATAVITLLAALRRVRRRSNTFRPLYIRRESALDVADLQSYTELACHLERAGLRLLPATPMQQIVRAKPNLSQRESTDLFLQLDGRTVQFLLVGTPNYNPLAVVHIGGDGSKDPAIEALSDGIRFMRPSLRALGYLKLSFLTTTSTIPHESRSEFRKSLGKTAQAKSMSKLADPEPVSSC